MSNCGGADFITHMKNFAAIAQLPAVTYNLEKEKQAFWWKNRELGKRVYGM